MNERYQPILNYIDSSQEEMVNLVQNWSNINTGTFNIEGIDTFRDFLSTDFQRLKANVKTVVFPEAKRMNSKGMIESFSVAKGLLVKKQAKNPLLKVLLCGHMDTVFSKNHSFQEAKREDNILYGPGVLDMKAGICILLKTLEAIENSQFKDIISWTVILNTDEEIGSPASSSILKKYAKGYDLALIFEPATEKGNLINIRKGSANFSIHSKGVSSHAGRNFFKGKNAIYYLTDFIKQVEPLSDQKMGITVNVGYIKGGCSANTVPEHAFCRMNLRTSTADDLKELSQTIYRSIDEINVRRNANLTILTESMRPPKLFDQKTKKLFEEISRCAKDLSIPLAWESSGGVCDGNLLASTGIPTIDTLGGVGGNIHTDKEFLFIDSLTQRAKLTTYFLLKIANKEINL